MSSPSEIVSQFMSHMQRGGDDAAMGLIADDCAYVNPPPMGTVHGPAGVRGVLEPFSRRPLRTS